MKKNRYGLLIFLGLLVGGSFYFSSPSSKGVAANEVVVYQSKSCGCCKKWVSHLQNNGFTVKSEYVEDVTDVKVKNNIPMKLASCHTAMINGYIVEGHVPADAIVKLLNEKPSIKGLSVPGMPMGSPGMEGSYKEQFEVLAFKNNNEVESFMSF